MPVSGHRSPSHSWENKFVCNLYKILFKEEQLKQKIKKFEIMKRLLKYIMPENKFIWADALFSEPRNVIWTKRSNV